MLNENNSVAVHMQPRRRRDWTPISSQKRKKSKRLSRKASILAAVCVCLGIGSVLAYHADDAQQFVSHLTAGFEYDDTLGRLQFVNNILPESAMVFLANDDYTPFEIAEPVQAPVTHGWSGDEPWFEYNHTGSVLACMSGEIMTVVQNREDAYTVRILHENGCESVYSGLTSVAYDEQDWIEQGQSIGTTDGRAAFEFRKDGLSVLPTFSQH